MCKLKSKTRCLSVAFALGFSLVARAELPTHPRQEFFVPLVEEYFTGTEPPREILFGSATAIRNDTALIGMPFTADGGHVGVFTRTKGEWQRTGTLSVPNTEEFGRAITMRNTTALVSSSDAVYVFKLRNGRWVRTDRLTLPAGDEPANFGASLKYQDGIAVIGAPRPEQPGTVYLFRISSAGKKLGVQRLHASDPTGEHDGFGIDVDMSVDAIVVGAFGSAYVFRPRRGQWVESQKLLLTDPAASRFGVTVAINKGLILVGAPSANAVYGYVPVHGTYVEQYKLQPRPDELESYEEFGSDIAMSQNFIAIAAREPFTPEPLLPGALVVTYARSGATINPIGVTRNDFLRVHISAANNWLLVGAPFDSARCPAHVCIGAAHLFDFNRVAQ